MALHKINVTFPDILRKAGVHQTDNSIPWVGPATYNTSVTNLGVVTKYRMRNGVRLKAFELHNRSGATINAGIGFRWANHTWMVGRYDGTTFTDIGATVRPLTAGTLATSTAIQVAGADQTGFVILSDRPFDWVSGDVTTAETDAGGATVPDHVLRYSSGATWVTLDANTPYVDNWTTTNAVWSVAAKQFVWAAPVDWTKTTSSHTGLPNGYYALHFQSADREASDVAAAVTGIEVGSMWSVDQITDNSIWEEEIANYDDAYAEALVAFFGTANAGNRIIATLETR